MRVQGRGKYQRTFRWAVGFALRPRCNYLAALYAWGLFRDDVPDRAHHFGGVLALHLVIGIEDDPFRFRIHAVHGRPSLLVLVEGADAVAPFGLLMSMTIGLSSMGSSDSTCSLVW